MNERTKKILYAYYYWCSPWEGEAGEMLFAVR
jgi:hypothetical protein